MTENQKAGLYSTLLNQHRNLHNQINEIKGSDIDLTKKQTDEIKRLEAEQVSIMQKIKILLSR